MQQHSSSHASGEDVSHLQDIVVALQQQHGAALAEDGAKGFVLPRERQPHQTIPVPARGEASRLSDFKKRHDDHFFSFA